MAANSMDLRTRVLRDADAGRPSKELAEKYFEMIDRHGSTREAIRAAVHGAR